MKRNPWPYAIAAYFVLFIAAMTSWIVFALRNDQELVRKDYYEQEIKYQGELESLNRASEASVQISHDAARKSLTVTLPSDATGTILFYRPSDSKLDHKIILSSQNSIDLRELAGGLWKVRLSWTAGGAEYRRDQTLVL